jgi:hypothetical protein
MYFQHAGGTSLAGWNADGTGPEPKLAGYSIPAPYANCLPGGNAVALAYLASGDYDSIAQNCPGAVVGNPANPPVGFGSFMTDGRATEQSCKTWVRFVVTRWNPASFPGNPEHRIHRGATYRLFRDEPDHGTGDTGAWTRLHDGANCTDDVAEDHRH